MAIAGSFFQKRDSHKITHMSGQHRMELYLLVVRKQQLWRIKDCKAVVVHMKKRRQVKNMVQKMIRWGKCKDNVTVE